MKHALLLLPLLLAACGAPSPHMRGADSTRISIGQSTYMVHVRGSEAEAIRVNVEYGPSSRGGMDRGRAAIERVSGCEIRAGSLAGDPVLMRAKLHCPVPGPG